MCFFIDIVWFPYFHLLPSMLFSHWVSDYAAQPPDRYSPRSGQMYRQEKDRKSALCLLVPFPHYAGLVNILSACFSLNSL
ncbi:hypothetical protein, partial [Xenorhabdus doucetiae]|uniref:hypothetical protein n=1 Tax=Xenorhabdus doucetiae TaxID=351671 RepID=UPI002B41502D